VRAGDNSLVKIESSCIKKNAGGILTNMDKYQTFENGNIMMVNELAFNEKEP